MDILDQGVDVASKALGTGSPEEQIKYNAVLIPFFYVSSAFSFGATLLFAFISMCLFAVGVLRLSDTVDSIWPMN